MSGPLDGLRVLDLTRLLPGAFATALLGDLGADVVKVEAPGGGDPMRDYEPRLASTSAYSWVLDRNKRSVVLDLRSADGAGALRRLARTADVLVESFRPGVADRLGVGYDDLRGENRALVYCSISGFGRGGPLEGAAGHDINYVGRAGVLGVTGLDGRPAIPGVQLGDVAGGALLGLVGLLAALHEAQRSGRGDHVDVSMTDGAFALLALQLGEHFATGRVPQPGAELLNGGVPCYAVYECADGRHLTVGALESRFWRELCDAVGRPDLVTTQMDPDAFAVWRELFATRPRDAWLEAFEGRDTCTGPVNDLAEAIADPQLRARGMVVRQDGEWQLATPVRLRERPASIRTPAPALGADTEGVLQEAGLPRDEIERLLAVAGADLTAATPEG